MADGREILGSLLTVSKKSISLYGNFHDYFPASQSPQLDLSISPGVMTAEKMRVADYSIPVQANCNT